MEKEKNGKKSKLESKLEEHWDFSQGAGFKKIYKYTVYVCVCACVCVQIFVFLESLDLCAKRVNV